MLRKKYLKVPTWEEWCHPPKVHLLNLWHIKVRKSYKCRRLQAKNIHNRNWSLLIGPNDSRRPEIAFWVWDYGRDLNILASPAQSGHFSHARVVRSCHKVLKLQDSKCRSSLAMTGDDRSGDVLLARPWEPWTASVWGSSSRQETGPRSPRRAPADIRGTRQISGALGRYVH